jgi:hemerythrin-like domain-containing protein
MSIPILRKTLQSFTKDTNDALFHTNILKAVYVISEKVIQHANQYKKTYYEFNIQMLSSYMDSEIYIKNIYTIIKELQKSFPDSKIQSKILTEGHSGARYDITDIERPYTFNTKNTGNYIVIDWS